MIDVKSIAKRLIPLLGIGALLVGPFANAWAGSLPDHFDVYTPGYFLDECKFDGEAHRYYHDYELERAAGVTPSISPYSAVSPIAILNWTNFNSVVFTVKNAGRYVESWNFYAHGEQRDRRGSVTGAPKSLAVTFSMLNGLYGSPESVDIIPQLNMMRYTLAYNANGGTWSAQPETVTYIWSNSVTSASSATLARTGYTFTGWNTAANGMGRDVAQNLKLEPSGGAYLQVEDHLTNVTLYAQWKANDYQLHLVLGKGIDKIYYKAQSSGEAASSPLEWRSTSADLDVPVAFDSEWQVYATPKTGYDYSGPTEKSPQKEKMTMAGATFEPSATPGTVTVSFSGNGATSGSVAKQTFTVDEAATLNENQYRRAYHVTFNPNSAGASVSPSSSDVEYVFLCWNSQADGKGAYTYKNQEWVTNPCGLTGKEVMLYAQWSSGPASVTLPTPILAGSSFGGWYAESACKTKLGDAGDRLVPTKDITLYAKWGRDSFTVSFRDGHRDAGDALIVMQSVAYGEAATPPAAPTHDGWRFVGWDSSDYLKVTQDLTVRALYESGNYHVTYNSNYQDGQTERMVMSVGCGPEASSDHITLLSADALDIPFNKKGYRFLGWAWSKNATQPDWLAGAEMAYSVIADYRGSDGRTNLYAVWQPISYTIVFASNGGMGTMSNQVLTYDRSALLTKNAFTLEGKTFYGWRDGQGHSYADEAEVVNLIATAGATITLTAQWQTSTTSERFVQFDPSGATNGTMAVQCFKGTAAQHLYANAYSKTGYTFAGWATSAVDAAARRVTYADRAEYAFKESDPVGMTKTLYAVWSPIHYTIIFNTGTNTVTGTIQPITNCEYDKPVELPTAGYTNVVSLAKPHDWELNGNLTGTNVTNLAVVDGEVVSLTAVFGDVGELSSAVGLTNAVLHEEAEPISGDGVKWHRQELSDVGHEVCVMCQDTDPEKTEKYGTKKGKWTLYMDVVGSGELDFSWFYYPRYGSGSARPKLSVFVDGVEATNLTKTVKTVKANWDRPITMCLDGEGVHRVEWILDGNINSDNYDDKICLDDIRWMPDSPWTPEYPTYNLTYANTKGVSLPTSLPKTYKVTSETFSFASLKDVSGWKFAGWSPSKIVKGTTGDITVTAKWTPVVETHTVTFDLAGGTRTGGGALKQQVEHGFDAVAPEFTPPAGKTFTGWSQSFANVTADLTVKALYDTVSYRIDYVNTLGLVNPNPLRYTKEDSIVFEALGNTAREVFTGWSPSKIAKGTTGNLTVTANWVTQQTWTVTFQLGEHIARTGGGALVQKVVDGGKAEAPTIVADEGYVFEGWDKDITCVRADLTTKSKVSAKSCTLSFNGVAESVPYGSMVTRSTFAEKTSGPTNLVCVGWTGSGCVPASGTSNEVEFQATGDGSLNWNYVTNWFVNFDATEGGSLTVVDSKGAVVEDDEFWTKNESWFTLEATPEEGYRFIGWRETDGSLTKAETTTRALFVTTPVSLCAVFGRNSCQVSFILGDHLTRTGGGALEQTVDQGEAAVAPTVKAATGYVFDNWDSDFSCVITNMTVRALVTTAKHNVTFVLGEHLSRTGGGALKQTVVHGKAAVEPKVKAESGYRFVGWDRSFTSVTEDLMVTAEVEEVKPAGPSVIIEVPMVEGKIPGKTTGQGVYAEGKKVTVKATPNKGYVFWGWYEDASLVSQLASYSFTMPDETVTLFARFATVTEDAASIRADVNGMDLFGVDEGVLVPLSPETNVWAGIYLEWPVAASAETAVKVAVSGLPSGLKFTTKDIVDSKTKLVKVPAMTIYGAPTAGGKTSTVKVMVTTAGKTKAVSTLALTVDALPTELIGTYAGGSTNDPTGSASVTLAKTGKVSGKWISEGRTWTITAANLTDYDSEAETFSAEVTLKSGKLVESEEFVFGVNNLGFGTVTSLFSAIYIPWKTDAELKEFAKDLKNKTFIYEDDDEGAELSGKVGASGMVTVKGVFDVGASKPYTASAKGTLVPVDEDLTNFELFVYYPSKAAKGFEGYAKTFVLHWNGVGFDIMN